MSIDEKDDRHRLVERLRAEWIGPLGEPDEVIEQNPVFTYLVGVLFPIESEAADGSPLIGGLLDEPLSADEADFEGDDADIFEDSEMPVEDDTEEDPGKNLVGSFGWAPSSMGMSFLHDSDHLEIRAFAGVYEQRGGAPAPAAVEFGSDTVGRATTSESEMSDDPTASTPRSWARRPIDEAVVIDARRSGTAAIFGGRARVTWRTRRFDRGSLTTVALSSAATVGRGEAKARPELCLFQAGFEVELNDGTLLPYPSSRPFTTSDEELELELRYRDKHSFGVGHGVSVDWGAADHPTAIRTAVMPAAEIPAIRARRGDGDFLRLDVLGDAEIDIEALQSGLRSFIQDYRAWSEEVDRKAESVAERHRIAADAIGSEIERAIVRMEEGVELLGRDAATLTSFRLANRAMRAQMLRSRSDSAEEPRWRPFQLGFILLSLASTVDGSHRDRELVDLIWFPTGGGKTEAYLGLAAIEMIRRRLVHGHAGGGTAVITRYTMRLLTAQQFQRAAILICALELLRRAEPALRGAPPFSIGLWLGNSTTPGTFAEAKVQRRSTLKEARPRNRFQVRACPWCDESILPVRRTADEGRYGIRADSARFEFFCPRAECEFHASLPVQVVDEAIYEEPPTMLVATVDKLARLAWIPKGAELFGLGSSACRPPSLIIQDELHLISGPLGTIVGVYEAAVRALLSWTGSPAKVVASTATTRAASSQISELMASDVALFPPSGIDADDNYFAEPDPDTPGRLYVGVMPQAHTPAWALGQMAADLLQAPVGLDMQGATLDAYWTLVVYHNSLRELGRTVTILRDDVRTNLDRMRDSTGAPTRVPARDGVEELNGNVDADELLRVLDQLGVGPDDDGEALDALATTNILSVGIDVARLGLMLVNGQPKSTSEYIQATSRVGRGAVPGLVVTMLRSSKPRDRSIFESFIPHHTSIYRFVEPSSVSPWALQARRRALRAILVILMRHAAGLSGNDDARMFRKDSVSTQRVVDAILAHVAEADPPESARVAEELRAAVDEWDRRASEARETGAGLKYRSAEASERLLRQFTESGAGWPVMNSMRSVDQVVRIRADGERR
ncbi:helicase-related protein [Microcella flavibacter]|uniref:helicase-related protein n=1 Tax=Microcella flavibacter TaxID=1804990 RepID=UPI00145713DF|nr:helicase-related protein [Microcella flavibacter]